MEETIIIDGVEYLTTGLSERENVFLESYKVLEFRLSKIENDHLSKTRKSMAIHLSKILKKK